MRKRQPKSWQGRGPELEAPAPKRAAPQFTFNGTAQPPKIRRSSIWDDLMDTVEEATLAKGVMVWCKWTLGSEDEARSAQQAVKQRLTAPEGQRYKTRVSGCELYVRLVPEGA